MYAYTHHRLQLIVCWLQNLQFSKGISWQHYRQSTSTRTLLKRPVIEFWRQKRRNWVNFPSWIRLVVAASLLMEFRWSYDLVYFPVGCCCDDLNVAGKISRPSAAVCLCVQIVSQPSTVYWRYGYLSQSHRNRQLLTMRLKQAEYVHVLLQGYSQPTFRVEIPSRTFLTDGRHPYIHEQILSLRFKQEIVYLIIFVRWQSSKCWRVCGFVDLRTGTWDGTLLPNVLYKASNFTTFRRTYLLCSLNGTSMWISVFWNMTEICHAYAVD